jgi:hypothetical protein
VTDRLRKAIADFVSAFPLVLRPMVHAKLATLVEALIAELRL